MSNASSNQYYLPQPSTWPITGSIALGLLGFGAALCGLGVLLRLWVPRVVESLVDAMPLVSVVVITVVVLAVVAGSADTVLSAGLLVAVVVVLHNAVGLALGYLAGRAVGLDEYERRAVSIEVGMQNSGLAAGLAAAHFAPAAALPAAIFSVWHNVSGSVLAGVWSRRPAGAVEVSPRG